MVLTHLERNTDPEVPQPYRAVFLNRGVSKTYLIWDEAHLRRRFNELDKTTTCPDAAEISQMLNNFPGVFDK